MRKDNEEVDANLDNLHKLPSPFARVTISVPARKTASPPVTNINNICTTIAGSISNRQYFSFVLTNGPQLGIVPSFQENLAPHQSDKIFLEEIMESTNRAGHPMPWKARMILALKLSSSLLQLSRTPWLAGGWSSRTICFPLCPDANAANTPHPDFTRPFISSAFARGNIPTSPMDTANPKSAFLELGIMLLEIWHRKSIEAQFDGEIIPNNYYSRMSLALKWRDETSNPTQDLYDQAVKHCILGLSGPAPTPDWDDKQMWSAFCGEVIEPLYKCCKQWRS